MSEPGSSVDDLDESMPEFDPMAWARLEHTTDEVDAAGAELIGKPSSLSPEDAYAIVNNWRSAHAFALNTLQMWLRRSTKKVDTTGLVAQRIKRLSSIESKLKRLPRLRLSIIQDIGGCRSVVADVARVDALRQLYKQSRMLHKLIKEDDYIRNPRPSGYRGIHLIYEYKSEQNKFHQGRKIEIQLRSGLQHAWATAVETVATFLQQPLKSSQGDEEWLKFFGCRSSQVTQPPRWWGAELVCFVESGCALLNRLPGVGSHRATIG